MNIDPEVLKYLKGESFQTGFTLDIGKTKHKIISREAAITDLIRNTSVIHIGCSDHMQVIKEKIAQNTWLHKLITDNATRCIGIDIDKESIEYIKKELGYQNVYYGNILTDAIEGIKESDWDYAVFGEIIEHLDDPVSFLKVFKMKYGANISRFIVSVPSVYNKHQFSNMLNYREIINSDHRFWFTPFTISKVLASAGFIPEKIIYANLQNLTTYELVIRKLKRYLGISPEYPFYYFNTIIVTGNIN